MSIREGNRELADGREMKEAFPWGGFKRGDETLLREKAGVQGQ